MDNERTPYDRTPGVEQHEQANVLTYTAGLVLAILATIASFVVAQTNLLWAPGVSVGLIVLAFAQIGVHLVFFCTWEAVRITPTISWRSPSGC
jgi:cytochrome bb3 quinol oxidase subunit 4 (EC 1.10.3.-)